MNLIASASKRLASIAIPAWLPWLIGAIVLAGAYGLGTLHEARRGAKAFEEYKGKQVAQTAKIVEKQVFVKGNTEIRVVERVKKIYVQGAAIETNIPLYIKPADADRFAVNAGFVRVIDAAWSGDAVGPAAESDREPASVPLYSIASVQVGNATSCRVWREQALGWRTYYRDQQIAINGKAGTWYAISPPDK